MATQSSELLPQKRFYRQRAHSNPISDHSVYYPISPSHIDWKNYFDSEKEITPTIADIGCGYGGLLFKLSPMFPDDGIIGFEIRIKVSDYVIDKIKAMRSTTPNAYNNIACIRSNAMKYLPNFFHKGQLKKMFFLYPDPHFKKSKHKWRIISDTLLAEYAYLLAIGGIVYAVTDVKDLFNWIVDTFDRHPLFQKLTDAEMVEDQVTKIITDCSEEGQKVTRNQGDKFITAYKRISLQL